MLILFRLHFYTPCFSNKNPHIRKTDLQCVPKIPGSLDAKFRRRKEQSSRSSRQVLSGGTTGPVVTMDTTTTLLPRAVRWYCYTQSSEPCKYFSNLANFYSVHNLQQFIYLLISVPNINTATLHNENNSYIKTTLVLSLFTIKFSHKYLMNKLSLAQRQGFHRFI